MRGYSLDPFILLKLFGKLLAQKWAFCRKINVYASLHEPPHRFSTTYRQILWNGGEQKNEADFLSPSPQGPQRKKFAIHVPGLRIQAPDFWFPIPNPDF
jgi:hypothetical protein